MGKEHQNWSPDLSMLTLFQGIFQTLTITYASEVCPVALRGYLTTYVNICWGWGQLIGIGVLKSFLNNNTQWSYRIPFALQVSMRRPRPLTVNILIFLLSGCGLHG